ncbi:nuclear pore membrane glycoprotein [Histomonas meleagridis]|uniref:nuclear pore membrane glycoprotein n=1 Tax=Histomonas meleagridis TaxID=135588 RepID=UPI00355AB53C|nr:nuclear pore membrane glycoprotein [Histomonas meleagridis]KAH0798804.1 nuclear pore membrane glycoprotein [Histomonas meleagridis]
MFFIFPFFCVSLFKISHLNALLQFKNQNSGKVPHFTISAEGSCVNWTSMNPSIIKVSPIYETRKCSKSALVEVVAVGPNRKATAILAEAQNGATLKCDVFVDNIVNISILTTTRSIYVDSSYETLSVQAYDSDHNIFTSLEGLDIKWSLDNTHLKSVSADEVVLPGITTKSSSLTIQGTKVGQTWVSVELLHLYSRVDFVVVEPIALFPSPIIRILPYSEVHFQLCSTRGIIAGDSSELRCVSEISLPSNQYLLKSSDPSILEINPKAIAYSKSEGLVTITATDKAITDNIASVLVQVLYPYRAEQETQYIALGDNPHFNPILYSRDGHKIDIFNEIKWEIEGEWNTIGKKEITLRYYDFSFKAIVIVCPPIVVEPTEVILPIDYSGFTISISGGSGSYTFNVDDNSILEFSNSKIRTKKEGITKIRVYDKMIQKYQSIINVIVSKKTIFC